MTIDRAYDATTDEWVLRDGGRVPARIGENLTDFYRKLARANRQPCEWPFGKCTCDKSPRAGNEPRWPLDPHAPK